MSFKRDGDDASMLRNLQHRRVADLISNHIPDEEAKLLSNGRLTCLVCSRRPIFDTISILSIHRKGKKHLIELSKYLSAKREIELRKEKNDHEFMVRSGALPPSEIVLGKGLFSACTSPYLSCAKRSKKDMHQRRATLNFGCEDNLPSCSELTQRKESMPTASSDVRKYLKGIKKKKEFKRSIEECRMNIMPKPTISLLPTIFPPQTMKCLEAEGSKHDMPPSQKLRTLDAQSVSAIKRADIDLTNKMSGWKKDRCGNWMKDPEAEFDSDEEEPVIQ